MKKKHPGKANPRPLDAVVRHPRYAVNESDLIDATHTLENLKQRYLTERGWKYTCDTPGSYWLWHKQMKDGRTLAVVESFALELEAAWCAERKAE